LLVATYTTLVPSDEQATADQEAVGTPLTTAHEAPLSELAYKRPLPLSAAYMYCPEEETATDCRLLAPMFMLTHEDP